MCDGINFSRVPFAFFAPRNSLRCLLTGLFLRSTRGRIGIQKIAAISNIILESKLNNGAFVGNNLNAAEIEGPGLRMRSGIFSDFASRLHNRNSISGGFQPVNKK